MQLEPGDLNEPEQKQHLFDKPRNVSRLLRGFYLICMLLFILDFILHRHAALAWEDYTGFYAIFGFVACVTLVLIAKQMRKIVMRKEDYYDVDD
jgi:hypothetical protein